MRDLRLGVVGCGTIAGTPVREGRVIPGNHAQACRALQGVQLVAAAEPDEGRREAFGRQWSVAPLYPNAAEMLAREELDIVTVATPPDGHEDACLAAVARGVRGVLCEKPLTGTAAGAARIVRTCRDAGCKLVVNFSRRWDESHRALAARIARGDLGEVTSVRGTYTGTLRGNGSHFVDTLRMLVPGEWEVEWASGLPTHVGDGTIEAVLRAHRTRAFLLPARGAEYFAFEIELLGTRGRARVVLHGNDIRIDLPEPQVHYPGYRFLAETSVLPQGTMDNATTRALAALVGAIRENREPDLQAEEHIASLALLDTIVVRAQARGEDER